MKDAKFTGEQNAFALRQAEVGTPVAEWFWPSADPELVPGKGENLPICGDNQGNAEKLASDFIF